MTRVTLNQIEAFYWIMRHGSFHAAASHLNLTQPTISIRIHQMEDSLGVKLFKKVGRRSRPTLEAETLLSKAEEMLNLAGDFDLKSLPTDPLRGRLRLGAPDSFGMVCMTELLATLKARYTGLTTAITIDKAPALCTALNNRELDLAFLTEPEVAPNVGIESIGPASHTWVAGSGLRLPDRIILPEDLANQEIFTFPAPSNQMMLVMNWFRAASIRPTAIRTCNNLSVILQLVAADVGVSLVPTGLLKSEPSGRSLRQLRTRPEIERPFYVAAFQKDKDGPALRAVMEIARPIMLRSLLVEPD
ncbi:MAG: LysR family transcriptional regulator [Nitratireductor sp.]|nr:LysR family transcriptional regulator [Nitratireductor sp.]